MQVTINGSIELSGSVTFSGSLASLLAEREDDLVYLVQSQINGLDGSILFFPENSEGPLEDISELVMIISPNNGVMNHGSTNFAVFDQAIFGSDQQIFYQPNTGSQPNLISTPEGNLSWFMSGSQSLIVSGGLDSTDLDWQEQGMYSFWVYWAGEGDDTIFAHKTDNDYRLSLGTNGVLGVNFNTMGPCTYLHPEGTFVQNTWHYVECVIDCELSSSADRAKLFVDRQYIEPDTISGSWPESLTTDATSFSIGTNDGENFWHGAIGNFYVCNGIPSDENRNVIGNYQRPVSGSF